MNLIDFTEKFYASAQGVLTVREIALKLKDDYKLNEKTLWNYTGIAVIVLSLVGNHGFWIMMLARILLLPVIIAVGYELLLVTARCGDNRFMRVVQWPGLLIQSLTTAEPDDLQLEVAVAAMKKSVELDAAGTVTPEMTEGISD